ncbi:MAG: glutamate--tRNA ligase family protein [Candidatus Carsonella ruddii]
MYNIRIAISPSGNPHLGNLFILLINYFLKIKICSNVILRFDDTNEKKNKTINNFLIVKSLKKNGIFIKNIINQKEFLVFFLKKIFFYKKNCFGKKMINKKINIKNLNYSYLIFFKNCRINFFDNNYGNLLYNIFLEKNIIIKNTGIPTYNFSSIINDIFNNIFIIIRGKEWLNQIPFQIILCNINIFFLNYNHLSNINNINNKKFSKRNLFNNNKKNIFIILKKIKKIFNYNKDIKILLFKNKKIFFKKINNYILKLNLVNLNLLNIFLKKKINNFFFSKINFNNKFFEFIKKNKLINKIKLIIFKIKKYEFI